MEQQNETIAKLFIRFLKEYKIYHRYVEELGGTQKLMEYVNNKSDDTIGLCRLPSAFAWAASPEGDLFWRTLLVIWNYILFSNDFITSGNITGEVRLYANDTVRDIIYNLSITTNLPRLREYRTLLTSY